MSAVSKTWLQYAQPCSVPVPKLPGGHVPEACDHLQHVPDAETAADRRVEAEDEKVLHVLAAHAVAEEEAVVVQDVDASPVFEGRHAR